jgi:hypothetical protein
MPKSSFVAPTTAVPINIGFTSLFDIVHRFCPTPNNVWQIKSKKGSVLTKGREAAS